MKFNVSTINWVTVASYTVGIITLLLIFALLSGKKIPLMSSDKGIFILLFVLGFAMSILGGFRDYPDGKFVMPGILMFSLMTLGISAMLLLVLMLVGVKMPFITTYKEAYVAMSIIIFMKWSLVHLYKVFQLFLWHIKQI